MQYKKKQPSKTSGLLKQIVSDGSDVSSARIINIMGAVTGTALITYHGIWLDTLTYDVFGVYLAYCGGVYAAGKYVSRRYNDDVDYGEPEEYNNRATKYSTYDNPNEQQ